MKIKGMFFEESIVMQVGKFAILCNDFENRYLSNGDYTKLEKVCSGLECYNLDACEELRLFLLAQKNLHSENDDFIKTFLYTNKSNKKIKDNERNCMEAFLDNTIDTDKQLFSCLLIIKRFRDNLMHGIKDWQGIISQKSIFELLNQILESINYKKLLKR